MTQPSILDLLLAEPGLAVCGLLVAAFAFVAWRKAAKVRRLDEQWLAEGAARRAAALWPRDPSSLSDDSPRDAA